MSLSTLKFFIRKAFYLSHFTVLNSRPYFTP